MAVWGHRLGGGAHLTGVGAAAGRGVWDWCRAAWRAPGPWARTGAGLLVDLGDVVCFGLGIDVRNQQVSEVVGVAGSEDIIGVLGGYADRRHDRRGCGPAALCLAFRRLSIQGVHGRPPRSRHCIRGHARAGRGILGLGGLWRARRRDMGRARGLRGLRHIGHGRWRRVGGMARCILLGPRHLRAGRRHLGGRRLGVVGGGLGAVRRRHRNPRRRG